MSRTQPQPVVMVERPISSPPPATGGEVRDPDDGREPSLDVLTFDVGGLRCALPAGDVVELHAVVATTPLPGAPEAVEGVIDYRGTIVAVVDLRGRLGLPRREPVLTDHLVMTRVGDRVVALRVDRAVDLTAVPVDRLHAGEALASGRHVAGVAALPDGLVLIHDAESFLSSDEVAALDAAVAELREPSGRAL